MTAYVPTYPEKDDIHLAVLFFERRNENGKIDAEYQIHHMYSRRLGWWRDEELTCEHFLARSTYKKIGGSTDSVFQNIPNTPLAKVKDLIQIQTDWLAEEGYSVVRDHKRVASFAEMYRLAERLKKSHRSWPSMRMIAKLCVRDPDQLSNLDVNPEFIAFVANVFPPKIWDMLNGKDDSVKSLENEGEIKTQGDLYSGNEIWGSW